MASTWIARIRVFFAVTAVIVAINVVRQLYRWFAFEEERVELVRLNHEVEGTALEVMRTQLQADSLRGVIQEMDGDLGAQRRGLQRLERRAGEGGLPPLLFQEYRQLLDETNDLVAVRNHSFEEWRTVVEGNHRAVRRYNALADSIRGIGAKMGEPYLSIPSPAEVATRHGLRVPPRPAAATAAPSTSD
jgi:hypothetical protein